MSRYNTALSSYLLSYLEDHSSVSHMPTHGASPAVIAASTDGNGKPQPFEPLGGNTFVAGNRTLQTSAEDARSNGLSTLTATRSIVSSVKGTAATKMKQLMSGRCNRVTELPFWR